MEMINLIKVITGAYGVKASFYSKQFENLENYDNGLRIQLFNENTSLSSLLALLQKSETGLLYEHTDSFGCKYYFFLLPENYEWQYCIVGPWRHSLANEDLKEIITENAIPEKLAKDFSTYFYDLPVVRDTNAWQALLIELLNLLWKNSQKIRLLYLDESLNKKVDSSSYFTHPENELAMEIVSKRYLKENKFLEAVSQGNKEKATEHVLSLSANGVKERSNDSLRNGKNFLSVSNTLMRKAVEKAHIHPLHIDNVSAEFAYRIEMARFPMELQNLSEQMVASYCDLVRKYSLRRYSKLISNVINDIDFNLQEPLSLAYIAEKFYISPVYLSKQFKKETGVNLIEYMNDKRLERAEDLLVHTKATINQIAEQCGFDDSSYFARLFKRKNKKTASQFRREKSLKD